MSELEKLLKRKVNFKKQSLRISDVKQLPKEYFFFVDDIRIVEPFMVASVDLRPNLPPIGRTDVAYVIYRHDKSVYQLIGKSPVIQEQAVLAVQKLEDDYIEESIFEVLGFI